MNDYTKLYIRPWGSSGSYNEFPYAIAGVNTIPEHDRSANDVDLEAYTNTLGKTVRNRVRANVASLEFSVPVMSGQELKDFFDRTKNVWLDCKFFYEPEWKWVSKKMYRSGTVKWHNYYVDKTNPLNNIYTDIEFQFVEE